MYLALVNLESVWKFVEKFLVEKILVLPGLEKHVQTIHRICSVCKEEFQSHNEKAKHMIVHTYCFICNKNFQYASLN